MKALMAGTLAALVLAATPAPVKEIACRHAQSPVHVDGRADEEAWKAAEAVTDFRLWHSLEAPTERTVVRFLYDDTHLYAHFECSDKDVFALYNDRDANLWESDVAELFFRPDPDNPIYYEFEFAPNGTVFDARFVNTGSGDFRRWRTWDCGVRVAARLNGTLNDWNDRDQSWSVEVAIPLAAFRETMGERPLAGQVWRFAAVRADLSATLESEERSSTSNCRDGNIHKQEDFFLMRFE